MEARGRDRKFNCNMGMNKIIPKLIIYLGSIFDFDRMAKVNKLRWIIKLAFTEPNGHGWWKMAQKQKPISLRYHFCSFSSVILIWRRFTSAKHTSPAARFIRNGEGIGQLAAIGGIHAVPLSLEVDWSNSNSCTAHSPHIRSGWIQKISPLLNPPKTFEDKVNLNPENLTLESILFLDLIFLAFSFLIVISMTELQFRNGCLWRTLPMGERWIVKWLRLTSYFKAFFVFFIILMGFKHVFWSAILRLIRFDG